MGTGVVTEGNAFTTLGTSGVVYAHTDHPAIDPQGRVHTFCCAVPGSWHVMGVTQAAGLSLKWLRDTMFLDAVRTAEGMRVDPYVLMDRQAARVPIGSNRLLYLPYLMGERTPHLDPDCPGSLHWLIGHAHPVRYAAGGDGRSGLLPAGQPGGAAGDGGESPDDVGLRRRRTQSLWRQMLADVYGCPVATTVSQEGPALGVAILAGVGAGLYPSVQEACRRFVRINPAQEPSAESSREYERYYQLYRRLYPALKDSYKALAELGE